MTVTIFAFATRLIGAFIIFAGGIKAFAPYGFRSHVSSLDIVPRRSLTAVVAVAAGFEVAWGAALLLGIAPSILLPLSAVALIALSIVSWRGVDSGKTTDCGCYGGYITLSMAQSLSMNALFVVVFGMAYALGVRGGIVMGPELFGVIALGIAAAGLAIAGDLHEQSTGHPLFKLSPLTVGRKWNHAWAGGATSKVAGDFFVSYLGTTCPCCKTQVRLANAMSHSKALAPVIGVMSARDDAVSTFIKENEISFAIGRISESLRGRLIRKFPTTALVRDGVIVEVFEGSMPGHHTASLAAAFFPEAVRTPATKPAA